MKAMFAPVLLGFCESVIRIVRGNFRPVNTFLDLVRLDSVSRLHRLENRNDDFRSGRAIQDYRRIQIDIVLI